MTLHQKSFMGLVIVALLIVLATLVLLWSDVHAAYVPQYTVSLYRGTTKSKDVVAVTEQAAWDACMTAAKALQATTTTKVSCKTPMLSLAVVADPPPPASVTLTWSAVTQNTNASAYTDPFGYVINYGTSPDQLTQSIDLNDPAATKYVVTGLPSGTYYFCVMARNTSNVRSTCSNIASKTL